MIKYLFNLYISIVLVIGLLTDKSYALKQYEIDLINVYKKLSPSVVSILTIAYDENMFLEPVPRQGAGSGVVIDKIGHILTNYHVIQGAEEIKVLFGKNSYPAKIVGVAPNNDLAILKVSAPHNILIPAKLGNSSKLQVGQTAIAIGNPFGILGRSMTSGIVSAVNRDIQTENGIYRGMIQTDAPINSGNSGGPLVNTDGEVIGINTLIFSKSGGSVGVGFAIPINVAKKFIPSLITKGQAVYPWLGVNLLPINPGVARELNLPVDYGLLVINVIKGSSADLAGIKGGNKYIIIGNGFKLPINGDIIIGLDSEEISNPEELSSYIETNKSVGDIVKVKIIRNNKVGYVNVKLQARPVSN
ncbi:MAG: 2-alkenal reductase [Candidatus Sericytochromatia bacterium]|nr:MAG: 2-alkenal reductase [Candidatus Sericytochromatia bacterium]